MRHHTRKLGTLSALCLGATIAAACSSSPASTEDAGTPADAGADTTTATQVDASSGSSDAAEGGVAAPDVTSEDADRTSEDGGAPDGNGTPDGNGASDGQGIEDANGGADATGADGADGSQGDPCLGRDQGLLSLPVSGITGPAPGTGQLSTVPSCASSSNGPEDAFTFQLASAGAVFVTAATSGGSPVVRVLDSCAATSDLACSASDPALAGAASLRAVLPAGTYVLAIGQTLPLGLTTPAPYALAASAFVPATNAACASPAALTPTVDGGAGTTGDARTGLVMDALCGRASDSGHLYYSVSVGAGQAWTVSVQPEGNWTALVEVLSSCASTTCAQMAASTAAGSAATVTIAGSDAGAPTTAILSVRGIDGASAGPFSIRVTAECTLPLGTNTNCSACGDNCSTLTSNPSLHIASASCTASGGAGKCSFVCAKNYGDCNGVASDGCETSLASPSSCGVCNNACNVNPAGGETCEVPADAGAYACTCDPNDGVLISTPGDLFGQAATCLNNDPPVLPWCFFDGQSGFCKEDTAVGVTWTCCEGWKHGSSCNTAVNDCCYSDSSLPPPGICCQVGNGGYPQCQ